MIFKKFLWVFIVGIILLIIYLPSYTKIQELRDKNRDLLEKNKRLKAENAIILEKELKRLESDQVYQEKILREKMGVVRKNEIPVKIIPAESQKKN
jgi:cell division protein FtsB